MDRVSIYCEVAKGWTDDIRRTLARHFEVQLGGLERLPDSNPDALTVFDVVLKDADRIASIRDWLKQKPNGAKAIFVVDRASRVEVTRAYSAGATDLVQRPIDGVELLSKLKRGAAAPPASADKLAALAGQGSFSADAGPGVCAAVETLQKMLQAALQGDVVDAAKIDAAGGAIVGQVGSQGLASWVEVVRKHHSQTYQHCMLVTGIAVGFGQHLGCSDKDQQRLSVAGMVHDIGKARIPLGILEKSGPLDQSELAIMRQHPELGVAVIDEKSGLQPEMIDMILHHHEYLDGSGYPHGLSGAEIGDLVRVMTISDVFGALIERRSYKPPMPSDRAYQVLLEMGSRLDQVLVREFRFVAGLDRPN